MVTLSRIGPIPDSGSISYRMIPCPVAVILSIFLYEENRLIEGYKYKGLLIPGRTLYQRISFLTHSSNTKYCSLSK
ncbi:hypothetical protein PILCRDRAFT_826646 [Piloderma croceum F 1598]|uniref:Uncharacterized protein n=1 Tax=Piloderma croceum (strain F 1598) TaxID=765440 RepID=A0A0C3BFP7_PILCF|nr:hypothetical protein PILCRDRAFT_826646 [Piloderma croceum F 1598]